MMTQQLKKKRKNSKDLTKEEEDALAKGMGDMLGVECKFKRPTEKLEKALAALELDFAKLQTKVDAVFTIGREENYNDREIGNMIRERMKDHYGNTTIWKVFEKYPDARQQQNHKKVSESETFDEKKEPNHKQSKQATSTYTNTNTTQEEQQTEQEPEAIYQMNPETYRSEDLEQYDKPFLCEIIRYLEKRLGI